MFLKCFFHHFMFAEFVHIPFSRWKKSIFLIKWDCIKLCAKFKVFGVLRFCNLFQLLNDHSSQRMASPFFQYRDASQNKNAVFCAVNAPGRNRIFFVTKQDMVRNRVELVPIRVGKPLLFGKNLLADVQRIAQVTCGMQYFDIHFLSCSQIFLLIIPN